MPLANTKVEEQHKKIANEEPKVADINTVLVVDDDEGWCFLSTKILQKAGVGKKILTAKNGVIALNQIETLAENGEQLPELILLDLKMPVMDGFEFLEAVTQSGVLNFNNTKVYVCTSSFLSKDKERAYLYPISGFITKPITQDILREIITPS